MLERRNDQIGPERDVLHLIDYHPDDQADGDQQTEHRLGQQQRGGKTAPPAAAGRQALHLPPEQHVDRRRAEQTAQKRSQLDADQMCIRDRLSVAQRKVSDFEISRHCDIFIKGSCYRFHCYFNNKDNKQFEIPTILQEFFTKITRNGYFS